MIKGAKVGSDPTRAFHGNAGGKRMLFNNIERLIILILYQYQTTLTTSKVAKSNGYSYDTVKKYLKS